MEKFMTNPKEPGGWQNAGQDIPDQPKGTPDRTFGSRQAFPRDVDEGLGRHHKRLTDEPDRQSNQARNKDQAEPGRRQ